MKAWLAPALIALSVGSGCSDSSGETTASHRAFDDGGLDVAADRVTGLDAADASDGDDPKCCPISPQPDCCMQYGGSRRDGSSCAYFCDGMPWPSAAWRRELDPNGCPRWIEPENPTGCCGCVEPDGSR